MTGKKTAEGGRHGGKGTAGLFTERVLCLKDHRIIPHGREYTLLAA